MFLFLAIADKKMSAMGVSMKGKVNYGLMIVFSCS